MAAPAAQVDPFFVSFGYHLVLKRRTTRIARTAGLRLIVRPTVFHPRRFITSEFFASVIGHLDLSSKRLADVGTGSGILALAAVRASAAHVTAVDVNPSAALTAAENARGCGFGDHFYGGVLEPLLGTGPVTHFDVIISSPPSFPGEPRDIAHRACRAGPKYRDVVSLFYQAREGLAPGGRVYFLVSSDSDLDLFSAPVVRAWFQARLVAEPRSSSSPLIFTSSRRFNP